MTLTDARKTLEVYNKWLRSDVNDEDPGRPTTDDIINAIDVAISVLPREGIKEVTAEQRLSYIIECLKKMKDGFDPFSNRTREEPDVIWRHAVFCKLKDDGYSYKKIASVSGYNHSTVIWGVRNIKDGLSIRYNVIVKIWEELNQILMDCNEV